MEAEELAAEQMYKDSRMLHTPVTSAQANHSFNGIIFDIRSKDAHEVEVLSISLGGMLGRIRIFARNCRWDKGVPKDGEDSFWAITLASAQKAGSWSQKGGACRAGRSTSRSGWTAIQDTASRSACFLLSQ